MSLPLGNPGTERQMPREFEGTVTQEEEKEKTKRKKRATGTESQGLSRNIEEQGRSLGEVMKTEQQRKTRNEIIGNIVLNLKGEVFQDVYGQKDELIRKLQSYEKM